MGQRIIRYAPGTAVAFGVRKLQKPKLCRSPCSRTLSRPSPALASSALSHLTRSVRRISIFAKSITCGVGFQCTPKPDPPPSSTVRFTGIMKYRYDWSSGKFLPSYHGFVRGVRALSKYNKRRMESEQFYLEQGMASSSRSDGNLSDSSEGSVTIF